MRVAAETTLPAGLRAAWAALVDWEEQARWMPDAASVRVVGERRSGIGTRVEVRTRVLGLPLFTDVLEVTRWRPSRELDVRHTRLVRGEGRWRLEPAGRGATRFTWEEDVRLPLPLLGELALLVYRPLMRRLMRRAMTALAWELESSVVRSSTRRTPPGPEGGPTRVRTDASRRRGSSRAG